MSNAAHPVAVSSNYPISLSNRSSYPASSSSRSSYLSPSFDATSTSATTTTPTNLNTPTIQIQVPDILERPRDKTRSSEVGASSLAFLYSEIVSYTQGRVSGISDLEKRLSLIGYHIGQRLLALHYHRLESPASSLTGSSLASAAAKAKPSRRETRLLPVLGWIHTQLWKAAFGKTADSLQKTVDKPDECESEQEGQRWRSSQSDVFEGSHAWKLYLSLENMIATNNPTFSKSICVPNDMSQLSVEAITAGIVEAALDGLGFPARVTAHSTPDAEFPLKTTILIKLDPEVMEREEALGPA